MSHILVSTLAETNLHCRTSLLPEFVWGTSKIVATFVYITITVMGERGDVGKPCYERSTETDFVILSRYLKVMGWNAFIFLHWKSVYDFPDI